MDPSCAVGRDIEGNNSHTSDLVIFFTGPKMILLSEDPSRRNSVTDLE